MAFDGMMMSLLKEELNMQLKDAVVSQVHQPNHDELVILFRTFTKNKKLLINTRADAPRVHITDFAPENPQTPPMLCMLLRKKLTGAKLVDIRQKENERIYDFIFSIINDIGDREELTLSVEIMGRYSNVIIIDKDSKVVDSLKRVDISMSRERLVLPKMQYEAPKSQDKVVLSEETIPEIISSVKESDKPLSKSLLSVVQGMSPVVAREIEYNVENGSLVEAELSKIYSVLSEHKGTPTMLLKNDGTPFDFTFIDINQYSDMAKKKTFDSYSEMLDDFYKEKDMVMRMKAKTQALRKTLTNTIERLSKKINLQKADLEKYKNREHLRIKADLLQANLFRIEKGAESITLENFYDENQDTIEIRLNPALSPAMNSQKLYKAYAKAKNGEIKVKEQIEIAKEELKYIESVLDVLEHAQSEKELVEIREELSEQGYIKKGRGKTKQSSSLPPLEYYSKDNFRILVGRNNRQNDILTLKYAKKSDLWFHTKDIPGSHVILETQGREVSDEAIYEAAKQAALHSKARNSNNVPVDYTKVKYVSKPNKARPGRVIYVNNKTIYVSLEN